MKGNEVGHWIADVHLPRFGQLRVPYVEKHRANATLAKMQRRGEIESAYGARREGNEYVVEYVRLAEPPNRTPWYVAGALAAFSAPIALAAAIWHAREALGLIALTVLGITAGAVILIVVINILGGLLSGRPGHCPGAWHK